VRVSAKTAGPTTLDVLIGQAELEGADARAGQVVKAGQTVRVSIGNAEIEPTERAPKPDAGPPDAGKPTPDASVAADAAPPADTIVAEVHGAGAKTGAAAAGPLAALAEGSSNLGAGSRLVVPAGVTVDVSRGGERVTVMGGSDVEVGPAAGGLVRLATGRLMMRSDSPGARTRVPGGYVELVKAGAGDVQAEVRVEKKTARVVSNHAELTLHGDVRAGTLSPGQSGSLDARGEATVDEAHVTTADLAIAPGESPTIHAGNGVANVRIPSDCPGDSLVEVTSRGTVRRSFGRADDPSAGIFRLVAGSHGYEASCIGAGSVQKGTIRVVADSGVAHLATKAATNQVDADGRHYHVLYQGRLPRMTFRWPGAPPEASIVLHAVAAPAAERTFPAPGGRAEFKEGAMPEGTYRFWFEVAGQPSLRSKDTSLVIGFDNAAPAAEIRSPADGDPLAPTVHVAGVAGEGASVSVSGVALPLDSQSRFSGDVPGPSPESRVLAVRIAHPVRGTHYYLRTFREAAGIRGSLQPPSPSLFP